MKPTLIYLYGPPASGKPTVAEKLADLTGFTLFHNHLTVNAIGSVFAFGSDAYEDVLRRLRLDVLQTAAKTGTDLIFTNNSAWRGADGRARFAEFAAEAQRVVETHGGRTLFVRLHAPLGILEERLQSDSRRAHKKLLDIGQLRELVASLDESSLHPGDLCIDTSVASPDAAARSISEVLA
jgi:chloramphenicol 3-O-phosphotransferase